MIIDLPSTTTSAISKKLVQLREEVGSMALGRVLTLLVVCDEAEIDHAIDVANDASRQHPCRVVCVVTANSRGAARIDAQIRLGGDAGASEVVVLRLYGPLTRQGKSVIIPLLLPDSPIVAWWPTEAPLDPGQDPIGAMAARRVTDAAASKRPLAALKARGSNYHPGDTDLAWTRLTLWRAQLAAALDQPPHAPVTSAIVTGATDSPSATLLAAWLAHALKCPVTLARSRAGTGIISVRLTRAHDTIDLVRPSGETATLTQTDQPDRRIALPHRSDAECLSDELRRLDPDEVYEEALLKGVPKLGPRSGPTSSEAQAVGAAPSVKEAAKTVRRIRRANAGVASNAMVTAEPPPEAPSTRAVKAATAEALGASAATETTPPDAPKTRAGRNAKKATS
ncbi:MAG: glucose-6-phosphate dehydrogenase assembly protein OpcA [Dermatophilaceae bacterium]